MPVGTQDCTNQKSIPSKIKSYPHSFTDISSSVKCAESNSKATDTFNEMKTHFDLVQSRSDLFNVFFANLTPLSPKAFGYLLRAKMGYYHAFALVETHKIASQHLQVKNKFLHEAKRHIAFNPALPTSERGSHGGEMIAWQRHLNISPVDPSVLSSIAEYTMQPPSIALHRRGFRKAR